MTTQIKCPQCSHAFPLEEVVSEEYKKELRKEMMEFKKKKDEELRKKEEEWNITAQRKEKELTQKLESQKKTFELQLEENLRKSISADYETRLRLLQTDNQQNAEKLKLAREKELEFLKKQKELDTQREELELSIERTLQTEKEKITQEVRRIEEQKIANKELDFNLRLAEYEKKMKDQERLIDEMKRKAEQGSMQLQGEVQEMALEELLRGAFPFDVVCEVGKGVRGADCILTIRNNFGQECGKIIFESKRTAGFKEDWIEKLKTDMRAEGADLGVIVTQALPKGMDRFGDKEGIWICSFAEAKALVGVLRDGIIRIFNAARKHENRGDKMHLLYDYLTSNEFAEQWKAVREGFLSMKLSIQKERDAMEKLWKAREKQLEKVLLNTSSIKGSIEGIAGQDTVDLTLLGDEDDDDDEETPRLMIR
jgi:hypothetical protein